MIDSNARRMFSYSTKINILLKYLIVVVTSQNWNDYVKIHYLFSVQEKRYIFVLLKLMFLYININIDVRKYVRHWLLSQKI